MQVLFNASSAVFFLIGLASMFIHALKKWVAGEIDGDLIHWYTVNKKMTVGAVLTCYGAIATAILSGALTDYTVGAQIIAAFGIGYAADTTNTQATTK
jgi:hypothetical protein